MYIGNIFSRDLYLWDSFPDHNDLVRGYILEKYFVETNPNHKLARCAPTAGCRRRVRGQRRAALLRALPRRIPTSTTRATTCSPTSCRGASSSATTQGQIQKIRNLAVRIYQADPQFKPLRDATHNQLSAGLIPQLQAYRDPLPPGRRARRSTS